MRLLSTGKAISKAASLPLPQIVRLEQEAGAHLHVANLALKIFHSPQEHRPLIPVRLVFVVQAGLDCAELPLEGAGELCALVVLLQEAGLNCEGHVCADCHQVTADCDSPLRQRFDGIRRASRPLFQPCRGPR